jgi:glycerate 2-kinase
VSTGRPAGRLETLRRSAREIWEAGVAAADPRAAVARALRARPWRPRADWELLAVGKGALAMAAGALEALGERGLSRGLVVTEARQAAAADAFATVRAAAALRVLGAGHPLPDQAGERAAREAEALVAGSRGPLLVLLSGGASAMLPAPAPGIGLEEKTATTRLLLDAGADISELNRVRRHLSRAKGGGLARLSAGREVLVLVLSDVLGDALEDVASGPFAADPTSFRDALAVVSRRGLHARLPSSVRRRLESGARGELAENPRPGDPALAAVEHRLVGSLGLSLDAAAAAAAERGFEVRRSREWVVGEAREAGAALARLLAEPEPRRPRAWIGGGETTVTVRGEGLGGRAQELALGCARAARGWDAGEWVLLCAGTDGRDGPGEAAGAVIDGGTLERARERGLDVDRCLERNDATPLLRATGDLLVTGPTGTNVGDLVVLLRAPRPAPARMG